MEERPLELWDVLTRWRAEGRRFVMATVISSRGFTPQKSGARMLIGLEETWGTIGGGAIEQEVLSQARALVAEGGSTLLERHLTRELGMCCGGEMSVFLEVVEAAPRLVVFGAGYIAKPLAAMAAACGFEVTVVDEREEWATAERFPMARVHLGSPESFARSWQTEGNELAVVATHDHALDQRLVQLLMARPLCFLGMIGSVPKQRKFALRLRARGFSDEQIGRLRTPLGFDIGARTPEEIAISVMAELVAVRRGAETRPGWVPPPRKGDAETDEPEGAHAADEALRGRGRR